MRKICIIPMKKISMKKGLLLTFFLILVFVAACIFLPEKNQDPESRFQAYCGGCHLAPSPASIPKNIWDNHILPEMAARLGYKYKDYDPYARNSMEENLYIKMSKTYPEKPAIDSIAWHEIRDYIMAHAPDAIPADTLRAKRNSGPALFKPAFLTLNENKPAAITDIQFEPAGGRFIIGDVYGNFHQWPGPADTILQVNTPAISYHQKEEALYVTEIGYMNPSEVPLGLLYRMLPGRTDTLARKLHRPVYTEVADLNDDGLDEILICEFGNLTGELSMLVQSGAHVEKRPLLPVPGTIKVEVEDMNRDGLKDIVVLAAQGNEGIYILYQKRGLRFRVNQVTRWEPEYGSSWFELADYNGDGYSDIVLANGDNADFSNFLKPYHGIRLLLNDGNNEFEEKWFYPIYGATRVLAEDFDLDGDLDFAVMAFFPDFGNSPEESFVFLENKEASQYLFEPHTFQESLAGRWLVMGKGDIGQDGDADLLLGSFIHLSPGREYQSIAERWRNEKVDLLFLENTTKN